MPLYRKYLAGALDASKADLWGDFIFSCMHNKNCEISIVRYNWHHATREYLERRYAYVSGNSISKDRIPSQGISPLGVRG